MDMQIVKKMFADAAVAKVRKADANGVKTSWSMDDQVAVAVQAIAECVKDSVEEKDIEQVIRATYNHSAIAQMLEKAFADTKDASGVAHFQRVSKEGKRQSWMSDLRKQAESAAPAQS